MPAWNRIDIPKETLEGFYLKQQLSIAQIAEKLDCSSEPIHRALKEYKIPTRTLSEACTKVLITKKQLKNLYFKEKLSMVEIARRLGLKDHTAILYKFKKLGIKSRGHLGLTKPINLTKSGFEYLYYHRRLSLNKIAKMTHCSESGLERRFKYYNLKSRGYKNRACKYKKNDFSGDLIEKAYLIGFRLGDLNVRKSVSVIQVRCSSTIPEQILLIKRIFRNYTTPKTRTFMDYEFQMPKTDIVCLVNNTFNFLLPKEDKIPNWIQRNKKIFFAFLTGYTDAEGCFHLHKAVKGGKIPFGVFEIQTQQKQIIYGLWKNMQKYEIFAPSPKISVKAGHIRSNNVKNNKDMWRIVVARKDSLWKLIHFLEPFLKHKKKLKMMSLIKENIIRRNEVPYGRPISLALPGLL